MRKKTVDEEKNRWKKKRKKLRKLEKLRKFYKDKLLFYKN